MHVFDLFEGHEERKDAPVKPTAAQADSKDQRAVSGVRGDIYNKTNIAGVRRAIDNAIQSEPGAKSEIEAIVSYLDKQAQKNAEQEREIEKLEREEDRLRQAQDSLVKDLSDKENRFRELTAQVASGKIDQVQAARMAQDIEAGRQPQVPTTQATAQPTAAQAAPATPVARPGLPVGVSGTQTPAQPKPQAQAQTKPAAQEPTTSRALGQMAQQLAPQGRVIRGKAQAPSADQAQLFDLPAGVVDFTKAKKDKEAASMGAFGALAADDKKVVNLKEQAEDPTVTLAKKNIQVVKNAYLAGKPEKVRIYNMQGLPMDLTQPVLHALVDVLGTIPDGPNKNALLINLFTNNAFLMTWLMDNVISKYVKTDTDPEAEPASDSPEQLRMLEGDVVPMTDNQTTNQAYADAMSFLKRVYANPNDPLVTTMRQDFAHKYQQRFQISQAPDRSYYLLDKQLSKKYKLPTPDFPLEGKMKSLAMQGGTVPETVTVVKMTGGQPQAIKAHASRELAQRHAQNIKKKYPSMQIGLADSTGQITMVGLNEEPYDGKSDWSDGQGQWSSENNLISSGNNPHGFSEAEEPLDATGAKMYQAKEKILVRHNGRDVAFFPDIETAKAYAQDMQRELKGFTTIHKVMREAQTDYQKRRQRERDIDAGRPVAKQREPKQTDYQKKRAQDKKDMELGEENKGLYYNVNKRKKAGTSRPAGHPKAPTAQAWKDAAKTAKKESVDPEVKAQVDNYFNNLIQDKKEQAIKYQGQAMLFFIGFSQAQNGRGMELLKKYFTPAQLGEVLDNIKQAKQLYPSFGKTTREQEIVKQGMTLGDKVIGNDNEQSHMQGVQRIFKGLLGPAADQAKISHVPVKESYWQRLQRERAEKQHAKAWSLLEQELKDL